MRTQISYENSRSPLVAWRMFKIAVLVLCVSMHIALPHASAESLKIVESDSCLTVSHNEKIVLVYNKKSPPVPEGIDPVYQRSGFLHPVNTPNGKTITETFPKDHPHQHGIFSAWVKTSFGDRSIDFWNLGGRTGRVVHERVVRVFQDDRSVGFEVDLLHRAEDPVVDILRERWKVTVFEPMGDFYCFDLESLQEAVTDIPLVIDQYHYGGMALRGISKWLLKTDKDSDFNDDLVREPSSFLNNLGQDRKTGNHTPSTWVALTGLIDRQSACITVLSHPENFRAPQPARLHGTKPYFCYSPCVNASFEISRENPIRERYRYLVTDAAADPVWIESQWREMAGPVAVEEKLSEPSKLNGIWLGPLKVGSVELRIALKISVGETGELFAKLDSIDQGAMDIPVDTVKFDDGLLRAELKTIGGTYEGKLDAVQTSFVGTWKQGPNSLPLTLKKSEGVFELKRSQEPKAPYPYRIEEVKFENAFDQVTLAGTLTLPAGAGPFAAVILISGSGPQDRDEALMGHKPFHVLADHLTRNGIAVLRYDDRGFGKSSGSFAEATSQEFKRDAIAALTCLEMRSDIDRQQIGVCGHSEGGLIAPMVAMDSPQIAFVILMAGTGVTGEDILYKQGELIARSGGADEESIAMNTAIQRKIFEHVRQAPSGSHFEDKLNDLLSSIDSDEKRKVAEATLKQQSSMIHSAWFRGFLIHDPRPILKKVSCPVLAINGEKDVQVDPKQNLPEIAKALQAGGNRDVTVKELPGLNHLFQSSKTGAISEYGQIEETISPAALDLISDWVLQHVKK